MEAGRLEEGVSLVPVKYTDELKARAVELVIHAQADPSTANGAIARVAKELGVSKEALRVWVRKHKDSGKATPVESVDLEAENRAGYGRSWRNRNAPMRSFAGRQLSSRRSSTAHQSDRRLHRR